MKLSARNQIKGKIVDIKKGAVNGIVVLDIGAGNTVSSSITMESISEMGLKIGDEAFAIIKASAVMIGTED